jgi:regulation of enolase protein 1 (concanavalin A-like superfamily)
MIYRNVLLITLAPIVLSAAPAPKDESAEKLKRIYGEWNDPDKDCKYTWKDDILQIALPAAWHLLFPGRRDSTNNAPRVLRELVGDFTAVVRVTFPIPKDVHKEFWPYCSGGLIVWESDKGHLVLRRSGGEVNGNAEAIWSHNYGATGVRISVQSPGKQADSAFLRLKREGDKLIPGWSRDGKKWKDLEPAEVTWRARIKVGIVAENCLGVPVEITFDHYSLTQPKK